VQFVCDRMSYIVLRGRWCNITVLKTHGPTKDDSDDSKDRSYEDLEQVFVSFAKNHMKILLENLNAKFETEDLFQLTVRNDTLHENNKLNCVITVNFPT
jgi:hypothetical protein